MRVSEVARRRKDRPRMSNISSGDLTGMAVRLVTTTAPESSWRTHTGMGKRGGTHYVGPADLPTHGGW